MADTTSRDALERAICARLPLCSPDELRVLDYVLSRLEIGRERYGALNLATDDRDFCEEERQEHADAVVYRGCNEIRRLDRVNADLRELAGEELLKARLRELRDADAQDRRRQWHEDAPGDEG